MQISNSAYKYHDNNYAKGSLVTFTLEFNKK